MGFRGQYLAAGLATNPEQARAAAALVEVEYAQDDHDVVLREDHPDAKPPDSGGEDVEQGDVDTALAARAVPGRTVKYAVSRQLMFSLTGYRAPTLQHVRLGAQADGRLTAFTFEAVSMSSHTKEFPEEAVKPARMMYRGEHRRITQRVVPFDVPVPSWMRAPGEAPGMVGLEIAMDELAVAKRLDPIEVRAINEPETDPDTGLPLCPQQYVRTRAPMTRTQHPAGRVRRRRSMPACSLPGACAFDDAGGFPP